VLCASFLYMSQCSHICTLRTVCKLRNTLSAMRGAPTSHCAQRDQDIRSLNVLRIMDISNHTVPSVMCKVGLSRTSRGGHGGRHHLLSVHVVGCPNILYCRVFETGVL
jgi:hypothetical protein